MGYNGGLIARGTRVGKFVVEEELGAGGMAVVYAARDPELGRRVALKVLRPTSADDEAHRMRLLRESQAMAMLNHPNVITVHEVGIEGGRVFLAQELVDGGTLGTWLKAPHAQAEILTLRALDMLGLAQAAGDGERGSGDQHGVGGIRPGGARLGDQVGQAVQMVHEAVSPDKGASADGRARPFIHIVSSGAVDEDVRCLTRTNLAARTPRVRSRAGTDRTGTGGDP